MRDDLEMLGLLKTDHFVELEESPISIVDEDRTDTVVKMNDVIGFKITPIPTVSVETLAWRVAVALTM